jgi:hypothetical protein
MDVTRGSNGSGSDGGSNIKGNTRAHVHVHVHAHVYHIYDILGQTSMGYLGARNLSWFPGR